ncbi:MAG: hypothetical protein APG12_00135 [Candidatus Methanofastidiosum methylothiophilum]|uniref:DUF488 domain-containing protein n=1 Tax=Candidatus Methanofastidiosum methylothiophilum TaxID=1705564 RepID=A0A150J2M9_9EURY|nr:MAG: hypothetical protein APG10_00823 [Candidatus Methanofastidiosum methylthiophilus]KYC47186.1 MAG: hypothetical protein APG11_01342 [Candidatus Methanofastidiosum methylthiophilus]KYC51471.1 MAG: hypothetical protein APG12_00135 [Candidatus Methanofastidiosum methylthiophilus]
MDSITFGRIDEVGGNKILSDYKVSNEPIIVYTIGHSNRNISDFIYILKKFNIELLIDIRTYPYSKYVYDYNKENLFRSLKGNDIEYLYRGDILGGLHPEGFDNYRRTQKYIDALHQLLREILMSNKTVALMCSERDYNNCHRRFISEDLEKIILENKYDIIIEHIVDERGIDKTLDQFM